MNKKMKREIALMLTIAFIFTMKVSIDRRNENKFKEVDTIDVTTKVEYIDKPKPKALSCGEIAKGIGSDFINHISPTAEPIDYSVCKENIKDTANDAKNAVTDGLDKAKNSNWYKKAKETTSDFIGKLKKWTTN